MWMAVGGSEGKHSKEKRVKKTWGGEQKERLMVVERRKPNKKSPLGPAGFGPQAQRVEAHSQC
jgi:hypothetical protein